MPRVNIYIPADLAEEIEKAGGSNALHISEICQRAIRTALADAVYIHSVRKHMQQLERITKAPERSIADTQTFIREQLGLDDDPFNALRDVTISEQGME